MPRSASAITASALGWPIAVSVVPSIGVDRDVGAGPSPLPTSSPLKSIGASSFSPSPITTDAVHRDGVDHQPHRVDGGAVGGDLVAAADPAAGGQRRGLGHADELHREVAVGALGHRGSSQVVAGAPHAAALPHPTASGVGIGAAGDEPRRSAYQASVRRTVSSIGVYEAELTLGAGAVVAVAVQEGARDLGAQRQLPPREPGRRARRHRAARPDHRARSERTRFGSPAGVAQELRRPRGVVSEAPFSR